MKLMILDGNSMANRAFYGVRPLNAPDGTPTNAVYGFAAILQKLLDEQKPDAVCVSFDLKAPTFRHQSYDGYKAKRKPMPEELAVQMPLIKELLDAMGIRRYELEGYEADDILGTAANKCESAGWDCVIVSGDKDSLQLVSDTTSVCNVKTRMGQTETVLYTPGRFFDEYGFEPKLMIDLKALMGDASDNIPGVPGIGEKTAQELLRRFGSLEKIFESIDAAEIKPAARKKLIEGRESADMSYWLATIVRDAPLEFRPEDSLWDKNYKPELFGLLKRLGFNRFIEKWGVSPDEAVVSAATVKTLTKVIISDAAAMAELKDTVSKAGRVAVLPLDGLDRIELCDGERVYEAAWSTAGEEYNALLKLLFSPETEKIAHNVKELMGSLIAEGLPLDGFVFDTALAEYLLDATAGDYSLPRLTQKYFGGELEGTQALYELYPELDKRLKELNMDKLYYDVELPLCRVLADMEQAGFLVDRAALYNFGESMNGDIDSLQNEIWEMAGKQFNINSPKQLGEVLYEDMKLPYGKKTKTGWSTNADSLEKLRGSYPIADRILDYRTLTKLKSTYADGLLKVIDPDGRIRTKFQMTVTATGRLSSTEPNLQNIPVRKKQGAQIRQMFVAPAGMVLVDADYSQIELRLLAHISGDKTMQDAFLSGEDFHAVTASHVFGVPLEEVTPAMRSGAKAVNFGIVYGISAFSLAQDIGVSQWEAKEYMDAYMGKYHGVRDYMKSIVEKAKEDGYVSTLFGRRRYLPELKSSNYNMRSFGERVALNMPIQGAAADLIKIAMVNVHRRLMAEKLRARLILQVHDELIVESPEEERETVERILKEEMENAVRLSVPLTVEVSSGRSWAEAH